MTSLVHATITLKSKEYKWYNAAYDGITSEENLVKMKMKEMKSILWHAYGVALRKKKDIEAQKVREVKLKLDIETSIEMYGSAYFEIWSRDCDMVESTCYVEINSYEEYESMEYDLAENAEGPFFCNLISQEHYINAIPYTRDRVMEAYENGKGNSIYI